VQLNAISGRGPSLAGRVPFPATVEGIEMTPHPSVRGRVVALVLMVLSSRLAVPPSE
jgi:hypothetical protein